MHQTFPLLGPPSSPGIYLIKNTKTNQVYVGKTRDLRARYNTWRGVFASGLGATNQALDKAVRSSDPGDWVFYVFMEAPVEQLLELEGQIIGKTKASIGDLCLNLLGPHATGTPVNSAVSVPLTVILDEKGNKMTYAAAASLAGIRPETLKKKLSAWRKKGRLEIKIGELL